MCFEKCNVLKIKKVPEHIKFFKMPTLHGGRKYVSKNVMLSKYKKVWKHIKFFKMPTLHGGKNMLSKDALQQHNRISTGHLHRILS